MFKELFTALKSGDVLDRAFSEFAEMLEHAQWMFVRATEVLHHRVKAEEVRDAIYQRDQAINELLRGIRRKIVRHLTINPGGDVPACLALMSIAKDAERIGDYCKNVFEVGRFIKDEFEVERYHGPVHEIQQEVERLFETVRRAWRESNHKSARSAVETAGGIRKRCDGIIEDLLRERGNIESYEAVAYSLLARHYKRVAGHLANVCTALFGKIEDLDFFRS